MCSGVAAIAEVAQQFGEGHVRQRTTCALTGKQQITARVQGARLGQNFKAAAGQGHVVIAPFRTTAFHAPTGNDPKPARRIDL